jgi:hypothetical protein
VALAVYAPSVQGLLLAERPTQINLAAPKVNTHAAEMTAGRPAGAPTSYILNEKCASEDTPAAISLAQNKREGCIALLKYA